jgi:hypothetical protein
MKGKDRILFEISAALDIQKPSVDKTNLSSKLKVLVLDVDLTKIKILLSTGNSKPE